LGNTDINKNTKFDQHFVTYGIIMEFGGVAVLIPLLWRRLCEVSETTVVQ
jgi:hypothetical protein